MTVGISASFSSIATTNEESGSESDIETKGGELYKYHLKLSVSLVPPPRYTAYLESKYTTAKLQ